MSENDPKKKSTDSGKAGGGKRSNSTGRPSSAASSNAASGGQPRPASRNKKAPNPGPEAGVEVNKRNDSDGSKNGAQRSKSGGGRGGANRKPSAGNQNDTATAARGNGNVKRSNPTGSPLPSQSPVLLPGSENPESGSNALQSLQRMITDLKSISPPSSTTPLSGNTLVSSVSTGNQLSTSNLPPTAPVFQPGAAVYPAPSLTSSSPQNKKLSPLGSNPGPFVPNFTSPSQHFQSNLGPMVEDANEFGTFEEGEIPTSNSWQPMQDFSQPTPQVASYPAPRFAALAQQEQQAETVPAVGRPQLAPGFTFGARRRASQPVNNLSPTIGEDDEDFQFPQTQTNDVYLLSRQQEALRRGETGVSDVSGMLAEQIAIQSQIEALQQQQQQLYQQQLASNQVMASLSNPPIASRINTHRRVQSTAPSLMGHGAFNNMPAMPMPGLPAMGSFGAGMGLPSFGDELSVARGHGRRHSLNVINKSGHPFGGSASSPVDGFDDGFNPPGALGSHSRNVSRADSSWRINGGAGSIIQPSTNLSQELQQAQAQLQSLQQFRAAAGGHHQKMASFSFPNMLPNMVAANMMGLGSMNMNAFQQQQQFQMQLQQQASQPQRKSLFAPYLPQASLPPLLAAGKLVVGILRVNKRNRSDAYVATEVLDADIYICGSKDRNRALEGDIVAVELLDVDEVWGTKKEKEEKKRKKEENAAYETKISGNRKNDKKKDDVEVEGQGLMLFEDEEVTDEVKPQYAGHVVAVVERMPGQLFSGTLGLLRPSSAATKEKQEAERREREGDRATEERKGPIERPKIVWFRPTDKRVPLIAIPTEQAPPDFVQNSELYTNRLFVACIKRHPISSLHPFGTLVEELGEIGDIEVETSALLKDCNFPSEEFTDNVLKCVPPTPWMIPDHELETRRDLRKSRIFTIDPQDAKDLDDALSIELNEDGTYDVGVHIADVSYFVKPNTPLDRDARKRGSSVYLVQRCVPMLPPTLCEQLCSLLPGQERLSFSVIFTLSNDGRVSGKWMGKTLIKSAAKLAYSHVQDVIDGKPLGNVVVAPEHEASAIEHDIRLLHLIAQHLREERVENGMLDLHGDELKFSLDSGGLPTDCRQSVGDESHRLIEEFMLLTNRTVAQQIAMSLPEQALLRRHEDPIDRRLAILEEKAKRLGCVIDTSSAGLLSQSFASIENQDARQILILSSHRAIHRARYFCAGMLDIAKYHHFAMNEALYTHFTSPIRRYADIIVHRQLEAVLSAPSGEIKFSMDRDSVAKVAQQSNIKKDSARLAQEQSQHLYLCHLIADLTHRYGPVIRKAIVVGVLDAAFDVLIPEFGIEKRVHVDQMPIENHVYDEHNFTLSIYWSTRDVITWLAENSDDEHLKKVKQNAEQHALKMEITSRSVLDESALFEDDDDEIVLPKDLQETESSQQRLLSKSKILPKFEGLREGDGHKIQDIRELMAVPVIVTADLTKSPAVIKVYSVNPFARKK